MNVIRLIIVIISVCFVLHADVKYSYSQGSKFIFKLKNGMEIKTWNILLEKGGRPLLMRTGMV
jgi:hypothetical protein